MPNERMFRFTKSYMEHEIVRGIKETGVKRIRLHDLRHSHVSLLINMGYSALAIGDRVGHEAVDITYRYAHLFPTVQTDMAKQLNLERETILNQSKSTALGKDGKSNVREECGCEEQVEIQDDSFPNVS